MKTDFKILLDMDGVICDFVGTWCCWKQLANPYVAGQNAGKWNMAEIFGMEPEEFWEPCNHSDFWAHMDWTRDGMSILKICEQSVGEKSVHILTSPSMSPNAWKGKAEWIAEHLPQYRSRLLMGPCKYLCANRGHILVDDGDHNVKAFREAGGVAVTVPRAWNELHHVSVEPANVQLEYIKALIYGATE
jgi:5'(3')-deoxyribonucleotidase